MDSSCHREHPGATLAQHLGEAQCASPFWPNVSLMAYLRMLILGGVEEDTSVRRRFQTTRSRPDIAPAWHAQRCTRRSRVSCTQSSGLLLYPLIEAQPLRRYPCVWVRHRVCGLHEVHSFPPRDVLNGAHVERSACHATASRQYPRRRDPPLIPRSAATTARTCRPTSTS